MKPDSRYSLAEHKVDSVLEMLRGRSQEILLPENDSLLKSVLDDLANAMEELRAAHAEVDAQREELDQVCQEVQRQHRRYVELFEDAPDGYVVTDLHGVIRQANRAAIELLDSARDFIVGQPLALFVSKKDKTAYFQKLNEMNALEAARDWELRFQPWRGKPFWASVSIAKVQVSEHADISLRWLIRDISDRKQADKVLRRYALLAGHGRDIILFMRQHDGRILEANAAAVEAYGYDYENLLMLTIQDLRALDTQALIMEQMKEAEGMGVLFETLHRRRDGSMFPVEVSSRGVTIGSTPTLISVIRDITERKRAEKIVTVRLHLLEFAITHSTEELLQKTLDEIGQLTNSPIGFLHFVESDQKTLSLQAWSTQTLNEFCSAEGKGRHYPIENAGVWADCVHEKRPVIHNDYSALPNRKGMPDGHPAVIRELVVPIMRSDRIVAILGIGNKTDNYTKEDVETASYLADVAWEIAGRKLVDEQLKKAYERLTTTFESITDGFLSVDCEWRITYLNKAGAELLGMKADDLIGGILWEIFPDAVDLEFYPRYLYAAESNTAVHFEEYYPSPLDKWWECHAYPSSEGLSIYFRDITEHKRLAVNAAHLAAIVESSDDAIIGKTLDGRIISWNRATEKIYGYAAEEAIGQHVSILIPEGIHDELPQILEKISRSESVEHYETYRRRKDGEVIRVCLSISPIRDKSGKVIGASTIPRDITEDKRIEEELYRSRDELELCVRDRTAQLGQSKDRISAAFDLSAVGQVEFDIRKNRFQRVNQRFREITGYGDDELLEMSFKDLTHPEDRAEDIEKFEQMLRGEKREYFNRKRYVRKDGSIKWVEVYSALLRDEGGLPVSSIAVITDVTEKKEAEDRIKNYTEELEHLNHELEEFAFIASHDLQEPLRKIQTFGNMLIRKHKASLNPEGQDYMDRVIKAANRMSELLRALLKYSRTGTILLSYKPVSLIEAARDAASDLEFLIKMAKGRVAISDELPTVDADAVLLRQLFQNIVENSIKYRKESEPPIVKIYGQISDSVCQIFIEDNGIGFDEEFTHKIFNPFERLHGMNSPYKGTGMGLAICQKIVQRHGGDNYSQEYSGKRLNFCRYPPNEAAGGKP